MNAVLRALDNPDLRQRPAVAGPDSVLSYGALQGQVRALGRTLRALGVRRLALAADNSPAWIVVDLACLSAGIACVPLPSFFTSAQVAHVLAAVGADHLLLPSDTTLGSTEGAQRIHLEIAGKRFECISLASPQTTDGAKVTFTSGTTGQPKGVCLAATTLETVAVSLAQTLAPLGLARHMVALPLATLLENLAGVYVPLLLGAQIHVPPLAELGYSGAAGLDAARFVDAIRRHRPESLILVPHLLQALVAAAESGAGFAESLRFIAVGGARVAAPLLARARALGLPVYEGYGLSECASVLTLNLPGADRPGSAGRTLPHARIEISSAGEVLAHGPHYLGYVGDAPVATAAPVATGDLGYVDADGFLHITGRKKNVFITAFGRNVSPEWLEAELIAERPIAQAAAFGEAQPWNVAVIVSPADDIVVSQAIACANARLPDYARIGKWLRAHAPFTLANGQLTANGRLHRTAIWSAYRVPLLDLYR